MPGNTDTLLLVTDTFKKKKKKFASCSASLSHRVDQAVDCGLWNVVQFLFNGCSKLLDIDGNCDMLSYTLIQSIPNVLNG